MDSNGNKRINIDIQVETSLIPIPNPNQPSSSSSTHQYLLEFILHDSDSWIYQPAHFGEVVDFPTQWITRRSGPFAFSPDISSSWSQTQMELDGIGLGHVFHFMVLSALRSRIYDILHDHGSQGQALFTLHIHIYRMNVIPIYFDWYGLILSVANGTHTSANAGFNVVPDAPVDYFDGNDVVDDDGEDDVDREKRAMEALERVKAEDKEIMEDTSCPICMEEMKVFEDDDQEMNDEGGAIRLPCKHIFHKKCIIRWFKKCYLCPLCRFNLFP